MKSKLVSFAIGMGLAVTGISVHAASDWTINLTTGATVGSAPTLMGVYGYAATDSTTSLGSYAVANHGDGNGLGMYSPNNTDNSHTLDNSGYKESLVLKFNQAVTLSELAIGWSSTDSDISVLRYTGSNVGGDTPVVTSGTGASTYSNLLTQQGWELVGQYSNMNPNNDNANDNPKPINGSNLSSSYWLIAAYNSVFTGSNSCTNSSTGDAKTCDNSNDYVKILSVGGATVAPPPPPGQVSEPGVLLLMGTAMMGLLGLRRRQARS